MYILSEPDAVSEESIVKKTIKKEPTVLEQVRSQRKWNLDRLDTALSRIDFCHPLFDFTTIGSSGKYLDETIEQLKRPYFSTDLFVDVRVNPFSRYTPKWNKNAVQELCSVNGIEYIHKPEYGVPKQIRDKLYAGIIDYKVFFELYDNTVLTLSNMTELYKLIENRHPSFLCTELGPIFCHRHRIALRLESDFNFIGFDL
jgi:hypothetical protein